MQIFFTILYLLLKHFHLSELFEFNLILSFRNQKLNLKMFQFSKNFKRAPCDSPRYASISLTVRSKAILAYI